MRGCFDGPDDQLLIIHGDRDLINSWEAAEEFVNHVRTIAKDAVVEILPVL
jgi:hypothetical protein